MCDAGIHIPRLKSGVKIELITSNSDYTLEIIDPEGGEIYITGTDRFEIPTKMHFLGSSINGIFNVGWIEYGKQILIKYPINDRVLFISPIRFAMIYTDTWEYVMDWPIPSGPT